jgi:hypothetical protein
MSNKWRRFEVLLPVKFNDGRAIPRKVLGEAVMEIVANFGAASYETQTVEGHWLHEGTMYRDDSTRLVVDLPDTAKNRKWMKQFKSRWKPRLEQLEIWMVSYRIDIE